MNERALTTGPIVVGEAESIAPAALPPKGTSTYTGLTVGRLAKLRLTGDGPRFLKIGKSVLYLRADLDTWLASRARTSTSNVCGLSGYHEDFADEADGSHESATGVKRHSGYRAPQRRARPP